MNTIDIVTSEMQSIHGANRVTEKLIFGNKYFENNNITLRKLYTNESIEDCDKYVSRLGNYEKGYAQKRRVIDNLKQLRIYRSYPVQSFMQFFVLAKSKKVVNKIIKEQNKPSAYFFHDISAAYFYLKKKKNNDVKTIFITHENSDPLEHVLINRPELKSTKAERKLRDRYRFVMTNVDKVITISRHAQDYAQEEYGINAAYIINGIEDTSIPHTGSTDGRLHIVVLGTVTYRKGQDIVVDAVHKLNIEEQNKICIHFVGNGDKYDAIKRQILDYNLEHVFILHGEVKEVDKVLAEMDVMFLPSRSDTVPISIIEGMRAGLPIFATSVGEIPYMISDSGKLIKATADSVLDSIRYALENTSELKDLSEKSRMAYVSKFNLETMINKYAKEINKVFN